MDFFCVKMPNNEDYGGDSLPVFANDEVKLKFIALHETQSQLNGLQAKAFELFQRIEQVQSHSVNVAEELRTSQQLVCHQLRIHSQNNRWK